MNILNVVCQFTDIVNWLNSCRERGRDRGRHSGRVARIPIGPPDFFRVGLRDRDEVFGIGLKIFGIGMIKNFGRPDLIPILLIFNFIV